MQPLTPRARRRQATRSVRVVARAGGCDPRPPRSFAFPPILTSLERKIVHAMAERLPPPGVLSQSFGSAGQRYITLFRAEAKAAETRTEDTRVRFSGVELDDESRERLLSALADETPADWTPVADFFNICQGRLREPAGFRDDDKRSCTAELRARIAELAVGARVELRVVSVARNNEVLLGKNRPPTFSSGRTCPI